MLAKLKDVTKFLIAYVWSRFLINKDIWVITERRAECKDNGYHLFKYIRENHPLLPVYYAIDADSEQRKNIEQYGHILNFNSIKHYTYALAAGKLIGAFLPCGIPDSMCFYKFGNKVLRGKRCFLQHGITKEKISSLMYENTQLDFFSCGAKPEYEYIQENFGYPSGILQYTGLARFDALQDQSLVGMDKFILLMPTWRQYLSSQTWGEREVEFEKTEYFQRFNHLLSNEHLINILEMHNIKLVFYPHHELQDKLCLFQVPGKHVVLASEKKYDVQALLKNASLLVTDYSSVAFDFAYMDKPLLYYQFDEEMYYSMHYMQGYFEYNEMGFGTVCHTEEMLISEIKWHIETKFANKEKYRDRIDRFFALKDNKNCERIFDQISSL